MAIQVASLFGVLRMDDTEFRSSAKNAREEMTGLGDRMQRIGGSITSLGANLTGLTAPAAAAFGIATKQAIDFDASITNIGAVLGLTTDQMDDLNVQLLDIGGSRRAGPQAVAEAFYDIVGGVADASTHMAILTAALDTAEAGGANLQATTSGLISVMNSYGFSADKASHVSDIFTRVVGVGVGTMDEFVSALGPVAGLAASTGVSFEELGTATAFLTTKGFTATQASTRLQAAITALIKPNQAMTDALKAAGIESGSAALKQYGLAGTLQKVSDALGGSTDAMAAALGTTEALGATTALLGDDFKGFSDNFAAGLDGATAAAQAIQNLSDQAKLDLLNSQMSELAISAGGALVPALLDVVDSVRPIIDNVIDWVNQNPELVAQIGMIVAGLAIAGPILIGAGAAIGAIGAIIGVVLSPIGLLIAAAVGLGVAFATNFGGIRDAVQPVLDQLGIYITTVVLPALQQLGDWFLNTALPAVVTFVTGTVLPAVQQFFDFLGQAWTTIQPGLQSLWDWFTVTALPGIVDFITNTVLPGVQDFIDLVVGIWTTIQPGLNDLWTWFTVDALPGIVDFITNTVLPAVQDFINLIQGIWVVIQPGLTSFFDWVTKTGLPAIQSALQWFNDNIVKPISDALGSLFSGIGNVSSGISSFGNSIFGPGTLLGGVGNSISQLVQIGQMTSGDYQGVHPAGSYVVGTGAQPQLFMPQQDMYGIPNIDQKMGGGDNYNVTVYANSASEGRAAADGFETRLRELRRQRG